MRFHHPLIRSAVRQLAPPRQVLEMYAALADVVVDEERRLWHRASSVVECDEAIAVALEEYARSARRRGALTSAGAALERAATLTADPGLGVARHVDAGYDAARETATRGIRIPMP